VNVRGVFIAAQAALKHLSQGGRIISIGSCVGERMMTPGLVAYSATLRRWSASSRDPSRATSQARTSPWTAAPTPDGAGPRPGARSHLPRKVDRPAGTVGNTRDSAAGAGNSPGPTGDSGRNLAIGAGLGSRSTGDLRSGPLGACGGTARRAIRVVTTRCRIGKSRGCGCNSSGSNTRQQNRCELREFCFHADRLPPRSGLLNRPK
jgi:hypothetical protein